MSNIVRYYDATKNPDGGALGGVPLGDIDQATWDGFAPHQQASVDAQPFYRKTKPSTAPSVSTAPPAEKPAAPDKES